MNGLLIRKMYAAILRSIETLEYNWDSNFDRFESILYRHVQGRAKTEKEDRQVKKWYCREYNKPEGCNKNSPHKAWIGTGANAQSKMVIHMCAACWMREKMHREHPEGSDGCPHWDM